MTSPLRGFNDKMTPVMGDSPVIEGEAEVISSFVIGGAE
jgi:hypothetical protein